MLSELIKKNITEQYCEFKHHLASGQNEHCIRCSGKSETDSPVHRIVHNIFAVVVIISIGSFFYYLVSMH